MELPDQLLNDEPIGLSSTPVANMSTSFGDDELNFSLISESTSESSASLIEKASPSMAVTTSRKFKRKTFKVIETTNVESSNEFDIFGKFVASELTHLPDIHAGRCLKARLQLLLANALLKAQNESQPQPLQVVPQKPKANHGNDAQTDH